MTPPRTVVSPGAARNAVALLAGAVLGVTWLGAAGPAAAGGSPDRPNVVVLLLDTARADHFSTDGYERETTPAFGELAKDAILFERAYSTSCWTVPSHASLFTGLYPMTHGATQETRHLDDELETLAEILGGEGYETVAYSANPWVSSRTNMLQGFERSKLMWQGRPGKMSGVSSETGLPHPTNREVRNWLDTRSTDRPFFLFVNYIEPHWKYSAPPVYQRRLMPDGEPIPADHPALFTIVRWYLKRSTLDPDLLPIRTASYDAELAYTDAIVERLVGDLENRGLLDETLLIVTSDHGENHGDQGHLGHSFALNDGVVRIPLLVRPPGWVEGALRRRDPVQIQDLYATILAATGIVRADSTPDARDLLGPPSPADRPVIAEYYYPEQVLGFLPEGSEDAPEIRPYLRRIRSIRVGADKFVWGSDGRHELYDLERDPGETTNRIAQAPETAQELQAALETIVAERERVPGRVTDPGDMDEETRERLRSLGYIR